MQEYSEELLSSRDGRVATITLNRPDRGNAVSDEMVAELARLVNDAASQADLVLLRGAGADFCVGRAPPPAPPPEREPEALERRRFSDVVFECYAAMRNTPVPVIAVVQGRAFGFGCAVAAACDITLAGESARFHLPEMAHSIMPTMVPKPKIVRYTRPQSGLGIALSTSKAIAALPARPCTRPTPNAL